MRLPASAMARVAALAGKASLGADPLTFLLLAGLAVEERRLAPIVVARHEDEPGDHEATEAA